MTHPCIRFLLCAVFILSGCTAEEPKPPAAPWSPDADAQGHSAPTKYTVRANAEIGKQLPISDQRDFENARRGLVAAEKDARVYRSSERTLWDTAAYDFLKDEAPASVHPSLWRQAQLNLIHGLFEVVDGVYQVRGYDLSNMSLIEGKSGWIVVDPLTASETASAALALANQHLGKRRVSAVIITHSHIDHFGGIAGLFADPKDAEGVAIIAPDGFMHEATSENVLAGVPMSRRATYMFGMPLARTPRGHVDSGLGKAPARGGIGIMAPTIIVDRTPQPIEVDGLEFVFQYAPESEAPSELMFYLPDRKAFCGAEVVSHVMHNLYTLRGAKVRDALRWSGAIQQSIDLFGDVEVVFASHHWPTWGNSQVLDYLKKQRDTYKYIHDQTVRLASSGATPREIAEELELPDSLALSFANRGYYGTVRHNSKAVYQGYFGWYDGNPVNLDPLPPADAGVRYVESMGGAAEVRRKAKEAFDRGEYRWVAMMLNHLVFAEPNDVEARELLAQSYDQLGYRAESGPWRDVYLTGAHELRHGVTDGGVDLAGAIDLLQQVPLERFFESMAARLDGPRAADNATKLNFIFSDLGETHVLWLENSVLHHQKRAADPDADATVKLTHDFFLRLVLRTIGLREAIFSDDLDIDGSRIALLSFFRLLDQPNPSFNIVTP
ncbi:MAG: MBL fold metallo-hydrolase [bacterium]|nr:MBL fold metallo-hydrolase [bacterium]